MGISFRHGMHQVAKNDSTIGLLFLSSESLRKKLFLSSVLVKKVGASSPTLSSAIRQLESNMAVSILYIGFSGALTLHIIYRNYAFK